MSKKKAKVEVANPRINRVAKIREYENAPALKVKHVAKLKSITFPAFIRTCSVQHNIIDVEQCASCGVLDDPIMMDEINEKPYCPECADELNELEKAPSGKLIPPKRYGAGSLGL